MARNEANFENKDFITIKNMTNIDVFLYIFFMIPVFIAAYYKDKLIDLGYFLKWILLSFFLIIFGYLFDNIQNSDTNTLSYFGSQMLFTFLIMNKITRNIYFYFFKREPEFGKFPKHKIDYIYSILIVSSLLTLPFLLNDLITKFFS
jgi:hypothetical protein